MKLFKATRWHFKSIVVMGVSQAAIFVFTFLVILVLVIILKTKERDLVVAYSIGYNEFETEGEDDQHDFSGLLHVTQFVQKAEDNGNLTVVRKFISHWKDTK